MMFIILIFFLFPNFLFCQSQNKVETSGKVQETQNLPSTSLSKCKTTSYQPGKEFPAPKLNLPKEFGDGKEFFPSFQCFNEYGLSDETAFNDLDIHKQLLITKRSNLIFYRKSSCEAGWKSKTKNCVSILFFQPLDGKYVFSKKYAVEALSGEKVRMIADEDENLYMFTYRQEVLGNKKNPKPIARKGVACIVKIDTKTDKVVFSTNLLGDPDQKDNHDFRHIFSPLAGGTVSLAYGDGKVVALFAKLLGYDDRIRARHQNSLFVAIDSNTGKEFNGADGYSHSFDQHVAYDPETKNFVGLEVGDTYQRAVGLTVIKIEQGKIERKNTKAYLIPGNQGQNETATSLGNIIPTSKGYLVSFITERKPMYPYNLNMQAIAKRTFDVALVRILKDLPKPESSSTNANVDPSWAGEVSKVKLNNQEVRNLGMKWVTKNKEGKKVFSNYTFALDANTLMAVNLDFTYRSLEFILLDSNGKVLKTQNVEDYVHPFVHDANHYYFSRDIKIDFSDTVASFYDEAGGVVGVAYKPRPNEADRTHRLAVLDKELNIKHIPIVIK